MTGACPVDDADDDAVAAAVAAASAGDLEMHPGV